MKFLILLAILPGIIIGFLIYKADKKEKEPKRELVKSFLLGFLAVILTLIISYLFGVVDLSVKLENWLEIFLYSFFCISLIEEFSKWICSYLFLRNNRNYNYLFDGIVYATFISLGFATIENILYTLSGGIVTGIIRAITTVPAHAFFGIFSGYYLSLSRKEQLAQNNKNKRKYLFYSLLVPFLLHGFYDFCLLTQNIIFFGVYFFFVVILYIMSIHQVKKLESIDAPFIKKKKLFCQNCGHRITNAFCSNCGVRVEEDS